MSRQIKGKYAKAKKELEIIILYTSNYTKNKDRMEIVNRLQTIGLKEGFDVPTERTIYRWIKEIKKHSDLNYELKQMLKHKRKAEIHLIDNKIHITIDLD
tara:strand:+ start:1144 stop:1443 length:300 start_codon:yes stop_codon:yes gene_type:complete